MNKTLRIALAVLLGAVCIGSIGVIVHRNRDYQAGVEAYAEAETLAGLPDWEELPESASDGQTPSAEPETPPDTVSEPAAETPDAEPSAPAAEDPYAEALRDMDFSALRAVNPEVQGWILIPGTAVSYPVVQGTDNQYYLTHTWKKTASAVGAIFLEARSRADLSDENTVIYGHRMNNGSMFAALKYYRTKQFWQQHPYVYLTDDSGTHTYEIFAAYEVSTSGAAYQIGFSGTESKQRFLDDCLSRAVYDTGIVPAVQDRILTLSTCTGNSHATRWVVQARLPMPAPAEAETEEVPVSAGASEPSQPDVQPLPEESAEVSVPEEVLAEADTEPLEGAEKTAENP